MTNAYSKFFSYKMIYIVVLPKKKKRLISNQLNMTWHDVLKKEKKNSEGVV